MMKAHWFFVKMEIKKSATVIAAFLIKYGNHTKESAIKAIRTKYNSAFYPDINYNLSLEMFEKNY